MKKCFTLLLLLICSASALLAQDVLMTAAQAQKFQEQVLATTGKTITLQTDFTQYKHMEMLINDIVSTGSMVYRSPNTVKWSYVDPFEYSVIFMDGKMRVNDEGKKSEVDIGSHKLLAKLNDLMTKSVRGDLFQDPDFEVVFFTGAKHDKMILTPKDEQLEAHIQRFELKFGKSEHAIEEITLVEPNADHTRIVFSDRKTNPTLGDEVFAH